MHQVDHKQHCKKEVGPRKICKPNTAKSTNLLSQADMARAAEASSVWCAELTAGKAGVSEIDLQPTSSLQAHEAHGRGLAKHKTTRAENNSF